MPLIKNASLCYNKQTMSAKIKLKRMGTKNRPFYRVVVQDEAFSTSGKIAAILGTYQPLQEPSAFTVDKQKTLDWIMKGAKPTSRVRILLGKAGVLPPIDLEKLNKKKKKGEPAEQPAAAAPETPVAAASAAETPAAGA